MSSHCCSEERKSKQLWFTLKLGKNKETRSRTNCFNWLYFPREITATEFSTEVVTQTQQQQLPPQQPQVPLQLQPQANLFGNILPDLLSLSPELALYPELLGLQPQLAQSDILNLQQQPQQLSQQPQRLLSKQQEKPVQKPVQNTQVDSFENIIPDDLLDPEILSILQEDPALLAAIQDDPSILNDALLDEQQYIESQLQTSQPKVYHKMKIDQ